MSTPSVVYVVHCVDAEGPVFEPLEATFERLATLFGIRDIEPTKENLALLQRKKIALGGREDEVARVFSPKLLRYNSDWSDIDAMLSCIMAPDFRATYPDSKGNGWIYNWHCLDNIGFKTNPRRRALGTHVVFDFYRAKIREMNSPDKIHWHFHAEPFIPEGLRQGTSYINSPSLYETVARKILERDWFPTVNRPGYHTERPDSHWFLEQWIPFDYANQSMAEDNTQHQSDNSLGGRWGDWRHATTDWSVYQPSHDNYQIPGQCRRKIARCLNIGTRLRLLTQDDVERAFARASTGEPTLLSFVNHDFRDMSDDVQATHQMLVEARAKFSNVQFQYCDGAEAMRLATFSPSQLAAQQPLDFSIQLKGSVLEIDLQKGATFGPQPFLAFQTHDHRFFHDNLDVLKPLTRWTYTFDEHSIPLRALKAIGVASNDKFGNVCLKKIVLE